MLYTIGTKGRDALARLGYTIAADYSEVIDEPMYSDAMEISKKLLEEFAAGRIEKSMLLTPVIH